MAGTLVAGSAHALDIQLRDVGVTPMRAEQLAGFEAAAAMWESQFSDPITVLINVSFAPLATGILGETASARTTHSYVNVRAALVANAATDSLGERNAVAQLPASTVSVQDIHGTRNDNQVTMSTANAKALGLGTGLDPIFGAALPFGADAAISFATGFDSTFDYNRADGIAATKTDFIGVAAHEIGHALGFFSHVDVQDGNPTFVIHPNTLDLWRFPETGSTHLVGTETRILRNGAAEYFDTVRNNLSFSRGSDFTGSDPLCATGSGRCQASHWRDSLVNALMDPTSARGELKDIKTDDHQGLDYVGYEEFRFLLPPRWDFGRCWWRWHCVFCPPSVLVPGFPPLPDPRIPRGANIGFAAALEVVLPGTKVPVLRGIRGYATFQQGQTNDSPILRGLPALKGEEQLFPTPVRPQSLPPALFNLYFESDSQNGVAFTGRSLLSESGAQYDPTLGKFGGYRIAVALDSAADGVAGDIDGLMTIELLADEAMIPDPEKKNTFTLAADGENHVIVVDEFAMGQCCVGAPLKEQEPNNTIASATSLNSVRNMSLTGSLTPGDVDYYRFIAPTNAKAWITVDTGGAMMAGANSRDSLVTLLEADGVTPIEVDNNDGSGNGADSTLESGLASAIAGPTLSGGTYYIRVEPAKTNLVIAPYRLLLTVTAGPILSETETNDTPNTADALLFNGECCDVIAGRIDHTNDVDYYTVQITGRSLLHISADGDPERDGTGTDLIVELLQPGGSTVLFSADSATAGTLANPAGEGFCYQVSGSGVYYVRVRGARGSVGSYQLMAAACPVVAPRLVITRTPNGPILTWPLGSIRYVLQSSTDLRTWTDVPGTPTVSEDGESRLSLPVSPAGHQFFRLSAPE